MHTNGRDLPVDGSNKPVKELSIQVLGQGISGNRGCCSVKPLHNALPHCFNGAGCQGRHQLVRCHLYMIVLSMDRRSVAREEGSYKQGRYSMGELSVRGRGTRGPGGSGHSQLCTGRDEWGSLRGLLLKPSCVLVRGGISRPQQVLRAGLEAAALSSPCSRLCSICLADCGIHILGGLQHPASFLSNKLNHVLSECHRAQADSLQNSLYAQLEQQHIATHLTVHCLHAAKGRTHL